MLIHSHNLFNFKCISFPCTASCNPFLRVFNHAVITNPIIIGSFIHTNATRVYCIWTILAKYYFTTFFTEHAFIAPILSLYNCLQSSFFRFFVPLKYFYLYSRSAFESSVAFRLKPDNH